MSQPHRQANLYFWLLVVMAWGLLSLGLAFSWSYGQPWVQELWHICQAKIQDLTEYLPVVWYPLMPGLLLLTIIRGGLSLLRQLRATQRLIHLFYPLREIPPARLQALLPAHRLSVEDIVFLNLAPAHAFSLGFWQPRLWLTAGLVNLLTDEELATVLAHEAHHCRQRDPLRLLIGRTLQSAFFFLPLVGQLAEAAELQQEVAADRSAILHVGSDLPLLCTLQKLLKQGSDSVVLSATYSPFNVTEARLRRLIYPTQLRTWRVVTSGWLINLGALMILSSLAFLPAQSLARHQEIGHCVSEPATTVQTFPSLPVLVQSDPQV
ncbi:MAG TPA: M56 family metallopeptidase [Anaerolineae bacterium]|nr:M56 family metallopeptidase [Anaerolineae bacterium]